ncbi:MAG TPA: hypothetical protein VIL37_09210 [Natronosporangium sp.]
MPARYGAAVLLAACLSACAGAAPEPRLVDDAGVVRESRFLLGGELPDDPPDPISDREWATIDRHGAAVVTPATGWDLRIAWFGGPCSTAPTVEVSSSRGEIVAVTVNHGPEVVGPGGCGDALVAHAVELRTSAAIAPDLAVSGHE